MAGDGAALERTLRFPTLRAAVSDVALVTEIGEADGFVPDLDLRHLEVTLRVGTDTGVGLSALDFAVARRFVLKEPGRQLLLRAQATSLLISTSPYPSEAPPQTDE